MSKLKAYFAHPFDTRFSDGEKKIIESLKEKGVEVLNPFDDEDNLCEKYGAKQYFSPKITNRYKLGREMWIKDLIQLRSCDMIVAWIPDKKAIGTSIELWEAFIRHKFIQIISPIQHPAFAYMLVGPNQQFKDIHDFERLRVMRW